VKTLLSRTLAALALASLTMTATAQVVINEIWNGGTTDEYIEFYNKGAAPVDMSNWTLVRRTNAATVDSSTVHTFAVGATIPAGGYYVIADTGAGITANATYTNVISTGNQSIALFNGATYIDGVGFGTGTIGEGTKHYSEPAGGDPAPFVMATNTGAKRSPNGQDTNVSTADWAPVTSAAGKTPGASNDTIVAATDVANIAAARAASLNTEIRITGTVTVTATTGTFTVSRHQFTVQDASGADGQSAIFIDDPSNLAGRAVTEGEVLTNLRGTLTNFNGLLQLTLTTPLGAGSMGSVPAPLSLTNAVTDINAVESELVVIHSASVAETGTWAASTNYALTSPGGLVVSVIRIGATSGLIGEPIPAGTFSVTGVVVENTSGGGGQIWPRTAADISGSASVADWSMFE
jgi:hypothetical protein